MLQPDGKNMPPRERGWLIDDEQGVQNGIFFYDASAGEKNKNKYRAEKASQEKQQNNKPSHDR